VPLQNTRPSGAQTIVMVGLGVHDDRPPNAIQPKLPDGIHLRWAVQADGGFPWYGFYLFRRPHVAEDATCFGAATLGWPVGLVGSAQFVSNRGTISSNAPLVLTDDFPQAHQAGLREFDLRGRTDLAFTPPREPLNWVQVRLGFHDAGNVRVTAIGLGGPVDLRDVAGRKGEVKVAVLQFDAITEVRFDSGPASLIDVCYTTVSHGALQRWEKLARLTYPIRLPLTHPAYPCTLGQNESLAGARRLAEKRIRYGPPAPWISTVQVPSAGTISVTNGSPIVIGNASAWQADQVGALLSVQGDDTAYLIVTVLSATKLVISRAFGGASQHGAGYEIRLDPFGQLHDSLAHLVSGGPAAGGMAQRFLPEPIAGGGQASVIMGSSLVAGTGTGWTVDLVGLGFRILGASGGTAILDGSSVVTGMGTQWSPAIIGLTFSVAGDDTGYTIVQVNSPVQLELDRAYLLPGAGPVGPVNYTITDRTTYTIVSVDVARQQITLDRGYERATVTGQPYVVAATLRAEQTQATGPIVPVQYPLPLVLLASINAAMAQILGLYWIDETARQGVTYDYLLVTDPQNVARLDPDAVLAELGAHGFANLDGYIAFDLEVGRAPALAPPGNPRVYALPPNPVQVPGPNLPSAGNMSGLRWDVARANPGAAWLSPGKAVMYHLWRADLGDGDVPPNPPRYRLLTRDGPLVVTVPVLDPGEVAQAPPDWPPFALQAIDSGLVDGWYAYEVSGIDLFGRHTTNSGPAPWYEWVPVPDPRPWYYADPPPALVPGEREISPGGVHDAVRLINRLAPPPPTGLEAYALDPADPTVLKDAAYNRWRQQLDPPAIRDVLIGLRVRWLWTRAHMRQAPDTHEFRIYQQPGRLNAKLGNTRNVGPAGNTESIVGTDIPNAEGADAYAGTELRIGSQSFPVVGSDVGDPLRVWVQRDPSYSAGTVSVTQNSFRVVGVGTNWDRHLSGLVLKVAGDQASYLITGVESPTALTVGQPYLAATGAGKAYSIAGRLPQAGAPCTIVIPQGHPLFEDVTQSTTWAKRIYAVDYAEHELQQGNVYERVTAQVLVLEDPAGRQLRGASAMVAGDQVTLDGTQDLSDPGLIGNPLILQNDHDPLQRTYGYLIRAVDPAARTITVYGLPDVGNAPSPWVIGSPLRTYEVFLPAPDADRGEPFASTLADPVVYAQIGVSAADANPHVPDNPVWLQAGRGGLGDRTGNEGRVAGPAAIVRVQRTPPPAPDVPRFNSAKVYATPADYHSHSFYTVRWTPTDGLKTHIFRALDDAVFQADWAWRKALIGQAAPPAPFVLDPDDQNDIDAYFPQEWRVNNRADPGYPATHARRVAIADSLNQLNALNPAVVFSAVRAAYRALTDDALRVLAGLPPTQRAFTQLTIQPLDPHEPDPGDPLVLRWRNRRGPDDPDEFVVGAAGNPLADPALCVYVDTLDGRASSRYFYRAGYVDGAHNRSKDLSLATPPVYFPRVTPPRAPVITKVLAVSDRDRQIVVRWASNREPNLSEYRVYRSQSKGATRDVRLMQQVHVEPVPAGDAALRPAEISWIDDTVPGRVTFYYRVVTVDQAGNVSQPSQAIAGRASDDPHPAPPVWNQPLMDDPAPGAVTLSWNAADRGLSSLVQRQLVGAVLWDNLSGWLARGDYRMVDDSRLKGVPYRYRLLVLDRAGNRNVAYSELLV
jgi:hypothetical protein